MSKSKKIRKIPFKKSDHLRPLLTDTLPYEVPVRFSNSGFYERVRKGALDKLDKDCNLPIFKSNRDFSIPYDYRIKKDSLDFRALSVIHPALQLEYCELYQKYAQLIIGLCSRSNFTLRRPSRVATHFVEKRRATKFLWTPSKNEVEVHSDGFADQNKSASSYFAYDRYGLIHKFYESSEYHSLEKRFARLRTLDISKCFHHIYTHSFTWAAKSKEYSKEHRDDSAFEQIFDKVMQRSNYNETNGIVVGAEVSRIFAEIILQSIDREVEDELTEMEVFAGVHYEVRRYVDDYFIFFNDYQVADICQKTFNKHLGRYKLYLNDSKTTTISRPFITGQTTAKIELAALADRMFSKHTRTKTEIRETLKQKHGDLIGPVRPPFHVKYVGIATHVASGYIRDIKTIVSKTDASFEGISNYFFTVISQKLSSLLEQIHIEDTSEREQERLIRFILLVSEVVFFVYAMSPRVRATYQISALCFLICRFLEQCDKEISEPLKNYMAEQIRIVLRDTALTEEGDNIEVLNLLAALKSFGPEYLLTPNELLSAYRLYQSKDNSINFSKNLFGYFQIVTFLHYIEDIPEYSDIKTALIVHVVKLFDAETDFKSIQRSSELSMLLFDFIRCPYVPHTAKVDLGKSVLKKFNKKDVTPRFSILMDVINKGDWFFSWDKKHDLGDILWKKELRSAY